MSKSAQERMTRFLDIEVGGRGVSFNVMCVEAVVTTEGWRRVMQHQGEEIAMGTAKERVSPEECAAIITWMVRQPSSWSGQAPTIDEMRTLMRADTSF